MAIKAIVFSDAQAGLIKTAFDDALEWGCEELTDLRGEIKRFYLTEQARRCCYCRKQIQTNHGRVWDVEHVIARALRPEFTFEPQNLAIACVDCNSAKSDQNVLVVERRTFPRRSDAYSIIHPHYDEWEDHLLFGNALFAPKSEKGARTIVVCKLYRYYNLEGGEALLTKDRRYADLAENMLLAKTALEAEPYSLAIGAMVKRAVADELKPNPAEED